MNKGQSQLILGIILVAILLTIVGASIAISYYVLIKSNVSNNQTSTTSTTITIETTTSTSSPSISATTSTASSTTSIILPATSTTTTIPPEDQTSNLIANELSQSISNITIEDIWNAINS